jgi:hypothetical protein
MLRTIFAFFLGLMLTAFVGVGVYTFHPPPERFANDLRDLGRREQALREAHAPNELTSTDRDSLQAIERRRNELIDAAAAARIPWARTTSIVLIVLATLAMAASLIGADRLHVISNGLLLGGVFMMLYGVGWIISTDTSVARFVVITIALAITLALAHARFVRRARRSVVGAALGALEADDASDLERRVRALEERLSAAATVLGKELHARDDVSSR